MRLFGRPLDATDLAVRRRVGYMSQGFAVPRPHGAQNLELQAQLFGMDRGRRQRADALLRRSAGRRHESLPMTLPLTASAAASRGLHGPELLILDGPTSGVDPVARDAFWSLLIELSRRDGVTIFLSTHFMNEAERCDRVSLMHAGRVLAEGSPADLARASAGGTLEDSFVGRLAAEQRGEGGAIAAASEPAPATASVAKAQARTQRRFSGYRMLSCARRETLELLRDPIRLAMSLIGSVLLMLIMGYGISLDVEDLRFAVLDRDHSPASRAYALELSGSPYLLEQPALDGHADIDRRMRSGELALAVKIPPGFEADPGNDLVVSGSTARSMRAIVAAT